MLSLIALSALAFTPTPSPDTRTFNIAIHDEYVEAGFEETELGDFVVVKQWDADLGQFVIVRGWDVAGPMTAEETETSLGDFVVVKQWDLRLGDLVVQFDGHYRDFAVSEEVGIEVILLQYEGVIYDWKVETGEAIDLD